MLGVFKSRDFLSFLHREGHILKLVNFWLSLLFGNKFVKFDDSLFYKLLTISQLVDNIFLQRAQKSVNPDD